MISVGATKKWPLLFVVLLVAAAVCGPIALTRTYRSARATETIGATGDNAAGWVINTGSGNLVSPSKKITGLANATASGDAVHFGQTVTTSTAGLMLAADKTLNDALFANGSRSLVLEQDDFCTVLAAVTTVTATNTVITSSLPWRVVLTGANASWDQVQTSQSSTHHCNSELTTGTTTTGSLALAGFSTSATLGVRMGANQTARFDVDLLVPVLSDGTNTYALRVGYGDSASAAPANAWQIEYSSAAPSSGNWIGRTCSASSCTTVNTNTIAVASGAFVRLTGTWDGTNACFFADGSSIGCTASTIPTSNDIGRVLHVLKSAGTTEVAIRVDFWDDSWQFTTTR